MNEKKINKRTSPTKKVEKKGAAVAEEHEIPDTPDTAGGRRRGKSVTKLRKGSEESEFPDTLDGGRRGRKSITKPFAKGIEETDGSDTPDAGRLRRRKSLNKTKGVRIEPMAIDITSGVESDDSDAGPKSAVKKKVGTKTATAKKEGGGTTGKKLTKKKKKKADASDTLENEAQALSSYTSEVRQTFPEEEQPQEAFLPDDVGDLKSPVPMSLWHKMAVEEHEEKSLKFVTPLRWQRGALMGRGAFGAVYFGLDKDCGQLFACKSIELTASDSAKYQSCLMALQKEIEILQKLEHPNIVRYLGCDLRDDSCLHLFMEYMPGGSLASLIQKFGFLNESVARVYTLQLLQGLEYLHSNNIAHRDIKACNILVNLKGVVKLSDFGLASKMSDLVGSSESTIIGTPNWMAPEVVRCQGHGKAADIWALGCTIVEMLTGSPPWTHCPNHFAVLYAIGSDGNIPEIPNDLSMQGQHFLKLCFNRNPVQRSTCAELLRHPFVLERSNTATTNTLAAPVPKEQPLNVEVSREESRPSVIVTVSALSSHQQALQAAEETAAKTRGLVPDNDRMAKVSMSSVCSQETRDVPQPLPSLGLYERRSLSQEQPAPTITVDPTPTPAPPVVAAPEPVSVKKPVRKKSMNSPRSPVKSPRKVRAKSIAISETSPPKTSPRKDRSPASDTPRRLSGLEKAESPRSSPRWPRRSSQIGFDTPTRRRSSVFTGGLDSLWDDSSRYEEDVPTLHLQPTEDWVRQHFGGTESIVCQATPPHSSSQLVTGDENGSVVVWDLQTFSEAYSAPGSASCFCFLPDMPSVVISGCVDGTIQVSDTREKTSMLLEGHSRAITGLQFLSSSHLVSGSEDSYLRMWDARKWKAFKQLKAHSEPVTALVHHSSVLLSSSLDRTVRTWDQSGRNSHTLSGHNAGVTCLAAEGSLVASGSRDMQVALWDLSSPSSFPRFLRGHKTAITSLICTDSQHVASAGGDGARLWNLSLSRKLSPLHLQKTAVVSLVRMPAYQAADPPFVVTCANEKRVSIFDVKNRSHEAILELDHPASTAHALGPSQLVVACRGGGLTLWGIPDDFSQRACY